MVADHSLRGACRMGGARCGPMPAGAATGGCWAGAASGSAATSRKLTGGQALLDTARACARRELAEELAQPEAARLDPQPRGWIHERETAIGRVHLGLVFAARWTAPEPPQPRPGEPLAALGFLPPAAVLADDRFERWSQLAVKLLSFGERES